jgi:hypothetical protein
VCEKVNDNEKYTTVLNLDSRHFKTDTLDVNFVSFFDSNKQLALSLTGLVSFVMRRTLSLKQMPRLAVVHTLTVHSAETKPKKKTIGQNQTPSARP